MVQIEKIRRIVERKRNEQGLSVRALASKSGISNHSQVSRLLSGKTTPTQEMLTKLCAGLECTKEERIEIFHAAGYLAPDEQEEDSDAA